MKIEVLFHGEEETQLVPAYLLDKLIAAGNVKAFLRSSGWAVIGRDPVRGSSMGLYMGPERRRAQKMKSCISCPQMVGGECVSGDCPDRYKKTKYYSFL